MAHEPFGVARGPTDVVKRAELPPRAAFALEDIQRICSSMFDLTISVSGHPSPFVTEGLVFGAYLSLIGESGSWEIALFGDDEGCSGLAKVIYAMEEHQRPAPEDIVDAMGELVNMVSGAMKARLDKLEHERLTIGVPMFQVSRADCEKYKTRVIPLISQHLVSPRFGGKLCLVWSERTPIALLREARACIGSTTDKLAVGSGLSALNELWEIVADRTTPENAAAILLCQGMLTDIINDQGTPSKSYVEEVIDELSKVLAEDWLLPLQMPEWPSRAGVTTGDAKPPQVAVERDAETIEMLNEFVLESLDGLEKCDELLVQIEQGRATAESIAALFRQFHTIKGVSSFHDLPDVEHLAHSTESLLAAVRDGKFALEHQAIDLVFEATSLMSRMMGRIRAAIVCNLSFPVSTSARALREKLEAFLRGEVVDTAGFRRHGASEEETPTEDATQKAAVKETVKIDVGLLAELDALLSQFDAPFHLLQAIGARSQELSNAYGAVLELKRQAQSLATRMRMVPLHPLFQKMTRMVRDLSKRTEKLAHLTLEGDDARVERSIAEKLNGPLVHMLRNAVDHGLENAHDRRAAGKPLIGQIRLSARLGEGHVIIEIADDGKGLDADAIWNKAVARGLLEPEFRPDDSRLYSLIFEPGFSTAREVTAISGRGVGMDVVRRELEALGGRIDIESVKGKGSLFRVTLPQA